MTITELIIQLDTIHQQHGDLPVYVQEQDIGWVQSDVIVWIDQFEHWDADPPLASGTVQCIKIGWPEHVPEVIESTES